MALGFEPMIFRTWVSSHNHLTRAPVRATPFICSPVVGSWMWQRVWRRPLEAWRDQPKLCKIKNCFDAKHKKRRRRHISDPSSVQAADDKNAPLRQCDQMVKLFFDIWPLATMKISQTKFQICQSRPFILPNKKYSVGKLPKTCKVLPNWRNFAKSGHTPLRHQNRGSVVYKIWAIGPWWSACSPSTPTIPVLIQLQQTGIFHWETIVFSKIGHDRPLFNLVSSLQYS